MNPMLITPRFSCRQRDNEGGGREMHTQKKGGAVQGWRPARLCCAQTAQGEGASCTQTRTKAGGGVGGVLHGEATGEGAAAEGGRVEGRGKRERVVSPAGRLAGWQGGGGGRGPRQALLPGEGCERVG